MKPLIASAIGGMSPYLVSLAKNFITSKPSQHFSDFVSPLFFVGLLLLALIGATVAFLLQETDLKKAFVLGISAPALISSTLSNAESSGKGLAIAFPNLVVTAHAQNIEPPGRLPAGQPSGRSLQIDLDSPVPVNIRLYGEKGNYMYTITLTSSSHIPVPNTAEKIQFAVGDKRSDFYSLPPPSAAGKVFDVKVTGIRNYGLAQAFGVPPDVEYRISVGERSL